MANLRLRLTEAICARSGPGRIEYAIRDLHQPNLSLRVRPNGTRSWIVRYRVEGRQHKATLGTYPDMSLKAARKAAIAFEIQPATKAEAPTMPSFTAFQIEHEKRHGAQFKPSGLASYRRYVRGQLLPAFRRKRLDAITRVAVVRWFEAYSLTSPGGANRALGILAQMLNCAERWGYFKGDWINPAAGIRRNRRNRVGTFLSMEQMERLGAVLSKQAGQGCVASALLHVLALTGCRVGEIIHLEWGNVLHDRLRLKDSKTGPRDVPLGVSAYRYIKTLRKATECRAPQEKDRVFPLPQDKSYEAVRKVWKKVRVDAILPSRLRIHDLRHSFASHAIMAGESLFTVSRLLGHRRLQTTARYAHLADHALLGSAETIGALILEQAEGRARRQTSKNCSAQPPATPSKAAQHSIKYVAQEPQHVVRRGS